MKNKSLSLLTLGILLALVLTSFASAAIAFSTVPTLSITSGSHTANITITPTGEEIDSVTITDITQNSKTIDLSISLVSANLYEITYTVPSDFGFYFGKTYSPTITAAGNTSGNVAQTISFEVAAPDKYENFDGNLQVNLDDITVEEGFGEDTDWYLMDKINADVEVRNDGIKEIRDIVVEWGLYDVENGNWIIKDKEKSFDLDDDEEKTFTLTFQLDKDALDEIDAGANNYKFYVWATGEDEDNDWKETSEYDSSEIDLQMENNFVVVNNVEISETVACGSDVQITAKVWNIGDEDQDNVYVIIYNKVLGINKKVEIGDIDSFEDSTLEVSLPIPANADEKSYVLEFSVYDEDDEIYQSENDDESKFSKIITLEDCSTTPKVSVVANLESESVVAGKEVTIKATITNTGTKTSTYILNIAGYADWASSLNVDKTSLTLDAEKSEEVLITLTINKDVSGEKELNIELVEGDDILTQPVKVTVEKSSLFPGITGLFSGTGDNWYLWGIGALNVLLIFIIIIVAMKVAKKKE
ncbi:MAG: putative S-layer protein [Candidatus Nanoarchaeia archaeon]|nr:putative S-layer protein [Candidatus Nanoarchaeia archaeon]MDD5357566.1 putative S-layer protein [Candidatus Nanoarchaeia archaeon]MDD5588485.1 putative S-layer protein [Candidatus Nanoarchaeia archaeon]